MIFGAQVTYGPLALTFLGPQIIWAHFLGGPEFFLGPIFSLGPKFCLGPNFFLGPKMSLTLKSHMGHWPLHF